jgi:hypothetical protein
VSTDIKAPVNPLTGELTTVTVANRHFEGGKGDVQGRVVAPGLAITPLPKLNPKHPDRYSVTHIPTGLAVIPEACGVHVQQAADVTVELGVDWSIPNKEEVTAAGKAAGFLEILIDARFSCSGRWCELGDGPEPPTWSARCTVCGWEWDEYDDVGDTEWPLTADEAKQLADRHECDPYVEVQSPAGEWMPPRLAPNGRPAPGQDPWNVEEVTAR